MWSHIEGAVIRIPAIPDHLHAAYEHSRARTVITLLSSVKETQESLYKNSLPSVELRNYPCAEFCAVATEVNLKCRF